MFLFAAGVVAPLFTTCVLLGSFVINILFAFYRSKKKRHKISQSVTDFFLYFFFRPQDFFLTWNGLFKKKKKTNKSCIRSRMKNIGLGME